MREKRLHSTLNRAPGSNGGSQVTNGMELASAPHTMYPQMGRNGLIFSVQGPGVIVETVVSAEGFISGI